VTAEPSAHPREWPLALGTLLLLAAAVSAVYAGAVHAPFIFDDRTAIIENPSIVRLWPPVGDAASRGPLNAPPLAPTARRPLPNLTLALNYRLGGLDPAGYHVVNIVLHVLSAAVLATIVRRTLGLPYFGTLRSVAGPLGLAVALAWALHPLNSEAVVYVTQRTEILVALFYLTTLWAALRYWSARARTSRAAWLGVATLACLAGMNSKEVMVSAPLAVLLYERTFLVESLRATRRSWPLYASLASTWIVLLLLSAFGVGGLSDPRNYISPLVWWMTQAKVLFLYLKLAVWPHPLSIHYAPAYLRSFAAAWPWVAAAALLAIATVALVWRRPAARFVVVVMVLVLGPTLVVPLPKMMAAERRMYLPLAGLMALAIVGGYRRLRPAPMSGAVVAFSVAMIALGLATMRRVAAYDTAVTIWQDAVRHQPADAMSHYNLGVALLDEDRPREALPAFERAVQLEPDHTKALDNLGATLERLERPVDAVAPLAEALRLDPDDEVAHNNLGSVLIALGRPEEAIGHLERALTIMRHDPKPVVYRNLGRALMASGRAQEAVTQLRRAVTLEPDDPESQASLANALLQAGRTEAAIAHYERALARRPDDAAVRNNLGIALLQLGRTPEAVAHLERVLGANPEHAGAHFNLGRALLAIDRPGDAVEHFRHVVQRDPADPRARFELAVAYARSGERDRAIATAEEGLAVARSHGETALAGEIDDWLRTHRAE
jgi:tetratricopeptide (TPR) repeat protein